MRKSPRRERNVDSGREQKEETLAETLISAIKIRTTQRRTTNATRDVHENNRRDGWRLDTLTETLKATCAKEALAKHDRSTIPKAQGPTSERWGSPRASSGELVLATSSCCLRLQYYLLHCYYSSNSKSSLLALDKSEESDLGLYLSTIHKGHQLPSKSWYKLKPALSARNLV